MNKENKKETRRKLAEGFALIGCGVALGASITWFIFSDRQFKIERQFHEAEGQKILDAVTKAVSNTVEPIEKIGADI